MAYSVHIAATADLPEVVQIDDESMTLFPTAGIFIDVPPDHPFTVDEQERWCRSVVEGRTFFAVDERGAHVGVAVLNHADGAPFLDQLSVRPVAMRKGAGRFLLRHAVAWAAGQRAAYLWLTTYAHLPWNRPFYEREGFVVVPEAECGVDIRHHLDDERAALPSPEHRVAMRYGL